MIALAALLACAPTAHVQRATPTPRGMVDVSAQLEASADVAGGLPLGGWAIEARIGITDEADLALRATTFGGGVGTRYALWQRGPAHLAFSPSLDLRSALTGVQSDLHAPIALELDASRSLSMVGEARIGLRQDWLSFTYPGAEARTVGVRSSLLVGGGLRLDWHPRRFSAALWGVALARPDRGIPPLVAAGADLGLRLGRWPEGAVRPAGGRRTPAPSSR